MTSRWFRRSRAQENTQRMDQAKAALTTAFMELDNQRTAVDSAVQAATDFLPEHRLAAQWASIRDACDTATTAYLSATSDLIPAPTADRPAMPGAGQPAATAAIDQAHQLLTSAHEAVKRFADRHRNQLSAASHAATEAHRSIDAATHTALAAQQELAHTDGRYLRYPSVQAASAELAAAQRAMAAEVSAGQLPQARDSANRLSEAAAQVRSALTEAPGKTLRSQQAVQSALTRIDAVHNRLTTIRPNYSLLLREFPAGSSDDLTGTETHAQTQITTAQDLVTRAADTLSHDNPEEALALIATARHHLSRADEYINAVATRLETLRALRADPTTKAQRLRFELRDAQHLAVTAGAVTTWGSVLDAQVDRIDRIVAQIHVPRPDYWAYSQALDEVSRFIDATVDRIRKDLRDTR